MNKQELYKSLIEIHKKGGKGLSGIVKIDSYENEQSMDELIADGLVKACDTGGSIGHPESNIFYMPTVGYNVWEDQGVDGKYNSRFNGRYLYFVRLYLNDLDAVTNSSMGITYADLVQNPSTMKDYSDWLTRNDAALKEMLNLSEYIPFTEVSLSSDDIAWIKEKKWYTNNEKISECLKQSKQALIDNVDISRNIVNLYNKLIDIDEDTEKVKGYKKEIEKINNESNIRKYINKWLESLDQNITIKTALKKLKNEKIKV